MPRGKPWTKEEIAILRQLIEEQASLDVIAARLHKSHDALRAKIKRLGLEVVDQRKTLRPTTTKLKLPEDLPSIEHVLRTLSAALKALEEPGLSKSEVMRLRSLIQGVKIYKELFADYVNYRGIEAKLAEAIEKIGENGFEKLPTRI